MGIEQLLKDYGIPYVTESEHHHASPGWVNITARFALARRTSTWG